MRAFLSADMEGVAGACSWEEMTKDNAAYAYIREQMNAEAIAACKGAIAAGATECLVKDAHATARNIIPAAFPQCVSFSRGWSGHPFSMMDELDESFDAVLMIGYHSRAGSGGSPLAHTMSSRLVASMRINGTPASEFMINALTAQYVGVPVAFVSGDEALCREVERYNANIVTVATQRGHGDSTVSVHPEVASERIRDGVEKALRGDPSRCQRALPPEVTIEIEFKDPTNAYARSFYPGARLVDDRCIALSTSDYFDVLRFIQFVV